MQDGETLMSHALCCSTDSKTLLFVDSQSTWDAYFSAALWITAYPLCWKEFQKSNKSLFCTGRLFLNFLCSLPKVKERIMAFFKSWEYPAILTFWLWLILSKLSHLDYSHFHSKQHQTPQEKSEQGNRPENEFLRRIEAKTKMDQFSHRDFVFPHSQWKTSFSSSMITCCFTSVFLRITCKNTFLCHALDQIPPCHPSQLSNGRFDPWIVKIESNVDIGLFENGSLSIAARLLRKHFGETS